MNGDGSDVYEDSFRKVAISSDGTFQPTLVLVGIRLGIDRVTPVYWEALKAILQMKQSVGIAGYVAPQKIPCFLQCADPMQCISRGRTGASHYFVGAQGNSIFYLDPHQPRPFLPYQEDPTKYTSEHVESCHTKRLRRLYLKEMDPSMLLGFLIKNEDDWHQFRHGVEEVRFLSL